VLAAERWISDPFRIPTDRAEFRCPMTSRRGAR
jgi:hypothetical protein